MIATIVNCIAVIFGSLLGLALAGRISEKFKAAVFDGAGITTMIIGISMAMASRQVIFLALALLSGGLLGTAWDIDGAILRFGSFLERLTLRKRDAVRGGAIQATRTADSAETGAGAAAETTDSARSQWDFGHGFLNSSVLFCVGAMALVGSFRAGTEGDYTLLLTKSILDGFMAVLMAAAMGPGVAFSALPILVYQGLLTLGAVYVKPFVSELMISELTGIGGAMVLMIAFNLLSLKKIKTANFLPSLVIIILFVVFNPFIEKIAGAMGL
jgi:uncharacterized membrane protein YqgA involved in biofilm formation